MKVLEIGPTGSPTALQSAVGIPDLTWETLDLAPRPGVTHVAKGDYEFPMPSDTYDIVLSANVIEHVKKTWRWLPEVVRVCRTGGTVITINPVSWPFHEYPVDCWRAFPDGMSALYEDCGLDVELSIFESIEAKRYRRSVPGRTPGWWLGKPWAQIYRLLGRLGLRVECAWDTITIGTKSGATAYLTR